MNTKLRRWAILWHRWMGVALCILFAMWFVSGIVMMYADYPRVDRQRLLETAQAVPVESVRVQPVSLAASFPEAQSLKLSALEGRPVYRVAIPQRKQAVVFADTGEKLAHVSASTARAIAARYAKLRPEEAEDHGLLEEEDQWTLNKAVRPLRPFHKFYWPAEGGTEVYVSQVSGEVMQYTTRNLRLGAYFGAIPHWLYFAPLRKDTGTWRSLVIALSAAGTIATLLGLYVGLFMYSPSKRYRARTGATSIPYSGMKRWHTTAGLLFGLFTFTWILSGMASMNPGQWSPEGPAPHISQTLAGRWTLAAFEFLPSSLPIPAGTKEIEFKMLAGQPFALAHHHQNRSLLLRPTGEAKEQLTDQEIAAALQTVPLREIRRVFEYEAYYVDRHGRKPLPAVAVTTAEGETHYIDPKSATVVTSYETRSRWNRWLYHGLHSFDLPWLYQRRPLWDILVIALCLGGTALSASGVWIGWQRLRRATRAGVSSRREKPQTSAAVADSAPAVH